MHEVQLKGGLPDRHVRPGSVEEVLDLLAANGKAAKLIAGGTDLILEFNRRMHPEVDLLIDLSGLPGLSSITTTETHAELGALVTHNQVIAHDGLTDRALPLVQACREIGSAQLRNRATVVGNVVTASPANDTITALRILDAELVIASLRGTRVRPLAGFHQGVRQSEIDDDEVVTAVRFRLLGPDEAGIYVKAGNRVAQAISVVHAAFLLDRGVEPARARVALGSVAPTIVEFETPWDLDDAWLARFAASVAGEITPIDDVRATADYRRAATETLVRRGLAALRDGVAAPEHAPPRLSLGGTAMQAMDGVELAPDDVIAAAVNGTAVEAPGVGLTLLDWLRDQAGPHAGIRLTGTKEGCAEGECGACTVVVNGAAVMSCLVPAASAHGARVDTVEALDAGGALDALQQAFVEHGAVQCGYCIPGFIVAARTLLDTVNEPTREQVVDALGGNLCRCTGYYSIIDAVVAAGETS